MGRGRRIHSGAGTFQSKIGWARALAGISIILSADTKIASTSESETRMSLEDAKGFRMHLVKQLADPGCPRSPERISVEEFGRCHNLDISQIRQLQLLFGPFADRDELWANVRWPSRFR
ncbi:hypothetical protein CCGE525_25705 (plasmid) [Rhizobium jaguaris]|uniref:Uncharacterized protein n=1 Tax=Rhizobium jaguaris TaxID=1312183 RepID=A0A387FYD5_9HYPH|nr:hypothetical protein CCGE525_25705 [Rhizobium jaguaris]